MLILRIDLLYVLRFFPPPDFLDGDREPEVRSTSGGHDGRAGVDLCGDHDGRAGGGVRGSNNGSGNSPR